MVAARGHPLRPERRLHRVEGARPRALDEMPLVRAIVYFNDVNTPNTIVPTRPGWRVDRRTFGELLRRPA